MPISDLYVIQFLVRETSAHQQPLTWKCEDSGTYATNVNGVTVNLFNTHSMGWSGLCLSLRSGEDSTHVEEPRPTSLFGRKYESDDHAALAQALRSLQKVISEQCRSRRVRAFDLRLSVHQDLLRRVLFGETPSGAA